jgi:DNA-binding transcriptional LysR family regulator
VNLKSLEALRAFMEGGSLKEAAERLHRTQPQVSRLLASLEEEAGFPLFTRKNRRLALTDQAREFYAQVERALSTWMRSTEWRDVSASSSSSMYASLPRRMLRTR